MLRLTAEEIERRVNSHLPAGERLVTAFQAMEGMAHLLSFRHRVVAVTDVAIHVYTAKLWRRCDPNRLLSSHPLDALVEQPRVKIAFERQLKIGERWLFVTYAWRRELAAALAAASGRPPV